jgi:Asp-tRNA(Asn)/Glu-tRNA(Gln) amidotransferase A subunit family amidase
VAWSIDTLGVQARCVDDVQLLYEVLSGDAARPAAPPSAPAIGALRDPLLDRCEPAVEDELRRVTGALTRAGATVREVRPPLELEVAVAAHRIVTFTECAALHEDRYRSSRAELGPKFRALLELGLVTPAASYVRAQRVRGRVVAGLEAVLGTVDALLLPVVPSPAPRDRSTTGDPSFQIPWTFAGLPALSLPTGTDGDGQPLAVQLVARPGTEHVMLDVARWCESVLAAGLGPPPP